MSYFLGPLEISHRAYIKEAFSPEDILISYVHDAIPCRSIQLCFERPSLVTSLPEHCLTHTNISCYLDPETSSCLHMSVHQPSKYKVSHVIFSYILTKRFKWGHCSIEVHNLGKHCFTRVWGSILQILVYVKNALPIF